MPRASSELGNRGSDSRAALSTRAFNAVDIAATAVFGIEGAAAAAHAGFDILGVLVIGFIVALAGGIIRDVLLGDLPPAAFRSPSRIITALVASAGTFVLLGAVDVVPAFLLTSLDAIGLALFAIAGAQKAHDQGANLWVVTMLGAITATGGGVVRDVLLERTPYVLSESVYGTAALAAALATGLLLKARMPTIALWVGFGVGFALRMLAAAFDWQLPHLT